MQFDDVDFVHTARVQRIYCLLFANIGACACALNILVTTPYMREVWDAPKSLFVFNMPLEISL